MRHKSKIAGFSWAKQQAVRCKGYRLTKPVDSFVFYFKSSQSLSALVAKEVAGVIVKCRTGGAPRSGLDEPAELGRYHQNRKEFFEALKPGRPWGVLCQCNNTRPLERMQLTPSHSISLENNIETQKQKLTEQLTRISGSSERQVLIKKIDEIERAIRVNRWLSSSGVKPPT
jgi:hypothetical protein